MTAHNLGLRFTKLAPPPPPPALTGLTVTDVLARSATLLPNVGKDANGNYPDRVFAVVIAAGAAVPNAAQIVAGDDGSNTDALWAAQGKVINVGAGNEIWMPGPNALQPNTAHRACVVPRYPGGSYGTVFDALFTTAQSGPVLVSTIPSHNFKLASRTADIKLVFDQTITQGTGATAVTLYDVDGAAPAETFNIATLAGSAGGALSLATTNVTNDTLVINPNATLTARRNYDIRVASGAILNAAGALSFTGLAAGAFAFKTNYAAGIASTILGAESSAMAWSCVDDTCKIAGTGAFDGAFSSKVTITGSPALVTNREGGLRFTTSAYAELATSAFPVGTQQVGTLIVDCSASPVDSNSGPNANTNSVMAFLKSSTQALNNNHFLSLAKADSSTRSSNLSVNAKNEAGAIQYKEVSTGGAFPKNPTYGVIAMTWDTNECIIATETLSAVLSPWTMPDDFLVLRWGPFNGSLYFDNKWGLYLPQKLTLSALQTRIANFRSFVA